MSTEVEPVTVPASAAKDSAAPVAPPAAGETPPALRLTGISKNFGGVDALVDVDFEVAPGEIHCLAGENGSGKSTLIKIVSGVYQPNPGGTIEFGGQRYEGLTPGMARRLGVQVIWQDLSLFPHLGRGREHRLRAATSASVPRPSRRRRDARAPRARCSGVSASSWTSTGPCGSCPSRTARWSRSAARSSRRHRSCSWTSRPPRSPSPRPGRSFRWCAGSPRPASRSSSSATGSSSSSRSRSGSPCSGTAGGSASSMPDRSATIASPSS